MDTHKNAPLTPKGREAMVRIVIEGGVTKAAAAHQFNTTAKTVAKWVERFRAEGVDRFGDRSSKPHSLPSQTPPATCAAVEALRRQRHTGKQIAAEVGVSTATVSRILRRLGLNRLSALEPAEPSRRYQRENPGELIHIDIKKLGKFNRIGHRITGDRTGQSNPRSRGKGPGWEYVHVCIDDASRIAFSQVMKNEKKGCALSSRRMSRKTAEAEFVYKPELNRTHPPIDETVKLPRQVRLAVEHAEELIAENNRGPLKSLPRAPRVDFPTLTLKSTRPWRG